jgi:hypothetical protein
MAYFGATPISVQVGGTAASNLTANTILAGGGASINFVGPGSAGQLLTSSGSGAPPVYTTATFPATATSTGTILRANGTNWVATTATYPTTTTASQILYSSATNVIGGLSTANNGTLVTSNTGVPSVLAGPGTTGNILQSNASAAPSFSTATYPSTAGTSGKVLISNGTNIVSSTPTFPNASATSGKFIQSDGTNWVASTPTLPTSAGTSGNILTSDGTNFTSQTPSAVGSSLVLISSQAASSSASISFTGLTTYTNYLLIFSQIVFAAGSTLQMLVSANNGSSYIATGYQSALNFQNYTTTLVSNQIQTTFFELYTGAGTSSTSGKVDIYNINSASNGVSIIGNAFLNSSPYYQFFFGNQSTTTINAIQISVVGGTNIASGRFSLYGYRES